VRVGLVGDDFIINPTYREVEIGDLDLVVAGSPDGVIMVEAGANQLPEQDIIEAIDFGYEAVRDLIAAQRELMAELGISIVTEEPPVVDSTLENYIVAKANRIKSSGMRL
jgi:polyribonucleotide nucleotidyltransferase